MLKIERVPSGIPGLDDMMSGGIPKGRVVLIVGGPGTGKTIMSAQFLVAGIKKYNEAGLFITLDESRDHLTREMATFGWDIPGLERDKKWAFTDISPTEKVGGETKPKRLTVGKREFSMESVMDNVRAGVRSVGAKRLALDPITSLVFQFPDIIQRRTVILELVEALSSTEATAIITTEL